MTKQKELKVLPVKRYKVSLDLSPELRWNEVLHDNHDKLMRAMLQLNALIPTGFISRCIELILCVCTYLHIVMYSQEIIAISKISGISIGRLVLLQLYYELNANCTSIITNSESGPCLTRTMDWELPLLKDLTIEVEFTSNGLTKFIATTWVGCVGVFTGMRPDHYAVSLNYRRTNHSLFRNVLKTLLYSWPTSFLIRDTLTQCKTYEEAVNILSTQKLISPCYLTVASADRSIMGLKPRACILIRDRDGLKPCDKNPENLEYSEKDYLVQTNHDKYQKIRGENIIYSYERLGVIDKLMTQDLISDPLKLMDSLNEHPIINEETIYTTQMIPLSNRYQTRVFE